MRRLVDYKSGWHDEEDSIIGDIGNRIHFKKYIELPHDEDFEAAQRELNTEAGYNKYLIRNLYFCEHISEHPLVAKLHNPYKQVLCTTLLRAVEDNLDAPVTAQLSLLSELALVREIACEPIGEYSFATEKIEALRRKLAELQSKGDEVNEVAKALDLASQLRDTNAAKAVKALEIVKEFCDKAARIDSLCREKFSVHTLHYVVAQMTRIMHDTLHDKGLDDLAVELGKTVEEKLVLPLPEAMNGRGSDEEAGNLGTKLTPDMIEETVRRMDDMCPGMPDVPSEDE